MSKRDYGRFNYRGVPNGRVSATKSTPLEGRRGDLWVYPGAGTGKFYVKKSSSESVTSSTTLQNDDDIVFNLPEPGVYNVIALLTIGGATAGDLKVAWAVSAGAAQLTTRRCIGPAIGTTAFDNTSMRMTAHNLTTEVSYGTAEAATGVIREEFLVETAGTGTVQLRWAQRTSSATATVLSSNTYATIEKLKPVCVAGISYYDGSSWSAAAF